MYLGSILAGAVLTFMIPSLVNAAEEVTPRPQRSQSSPSVGYIGWLGFAVSPGGRVWKSSEPLKDENSARNDAKNACETTTIVTCNAIAVKETDDISVVKCNYNGRKGSFVGGSHLNKQTEVSFVSARAWGFPESTCVEFYTW
jgi:hypothetical protein